jgi:ribosomal protein S24E
MPLRPDNSKMNLTIKQETESPLLSRKEIKAEVIFEKATPSNDEVAKDIASKTKSSPELIVVKHIYTKFGETKADVEAYIYQSKEALEKIEPRKKVKAGEKKEGESDEAAPAKEAPKPAPKAEEKPAEEAKSAPKAEEKKEEKPAEAPKAEEKKE